ncbi:MAG: nitroreductase family protein [Anaerolineae bacterium]
MLSGQSVIDLIERRYSCRSYAETPIAAETQARLSAFMAEHAVGPLGTRVRLRLIAAEEGDAAALKGLGTYGFIRGAMGFVAGVVPEEGDFVLEDFGFVMERVVLFATGLGLGTVWLGGTFTKSRFAEKLGVDEGESVPAVVATGTPADEPRGLDRWIRRGAKSDQRRPWSELFFEGGFDAPLSREAAGPYDTVLEMVRQAPSASNKQPWRLVRDGERWHLFLRRTRGYAARNALIGIADMQRIDMGIAMCHFALTAEEVGLSGRWVREMPEIATPDDRTLYVVTWVSRAVDEDL